MSDRYCLFQRGTRLNEFTRTEIRLSQYNQGHGIDFKPFATNVETLENCAVQLEGVHLTNAQPMVGAFQGRIIYVTDQDITAAADSRSQRYRVFTPDQRTKIDAGFNALKDRGRDAR